MRTPRLILPELLAARRMRDQGCTWDFIAEHFSVSNATIRRALGALPVQSRPKRALSQGDIRPFSVKVVAT